MELTEKLKHLEENVKTLREIKASVTLDALKSNKRYEWEIRYGLFESIQIVIDIACKLSSIFNLGNPKSYRECIELLARHRYLERGLAEKVEGMAGLRNLLVHEYVEIDDEKLYSFLERLDDFLLFAQAMREHI
ncbi:type VII toxin-antitoxin system HepT family RNase toxin [Hydrogenimonas sp.]